MRYCELKRKHREAMNNFPLGFAFSEKQFQDMLTRLDATPGQLVKLGAGGFVRKDDYQQLNTLVDQHINETQEAMKDDSFLKDAMIYELGNHEYCITYDPSDALSVLEVSLDDERVNKIFQEAKREYLKSIRE